MRYMCKGTDHQIVGELCPEGKVVVCFPLEASGHSNVYVYGRGGYIIQSFSIPDGCTEITFTDNAPLLEGEIERAKNDQT
jgi:hypothetical protein